MAKFEITYKKYIQPFEGGYVNHPADKGGETYAGIARNKFPNWEGWVFIDFKKRTEFTNGIPRNTKFEQIQYAVDDFYRKRWDSYKLSEIKSQRVADLLFDYIIHSGANAAITAIQQLVGAKVDGLIGPETIGKINASDELVLFRRLLDQRERFLKYLVSKDESQKVFESGWMNRIKVFRDTIPESERLPGKIILPAVILLGIGLFLT